MKNFRVFILLALLITSLGLTACNGYDVGVRVSSVISAVLTVAQAETPSIPAVDQPAFTSFVTLGNTLDAQLNTCLAAANSGIVKSAKFLACFNAFSTGLASPAEIVQLRLLNPGTQNTVQKYLVAITVGLNVGIAAFSGTQKAAPVVGAVPSARDMQNLQQDVAQLNGVTFNNIHYRGDSTWAVE